MWSDYEDRTKGSRELFERAKRVLPGGVSYAIRYFQPYPFYARKAKGAYVWDVDGNRYIDLWMEHGAAVLGHNDERIINAVKEQLELGLHFGWANEWEILWAEAVTDWFRMDMVRPTNSGTEANMYAIRLARAYTGRRAIVKAIGGWHGGYDALMRGIHYPPERIESLGIPGDITRDTVLIRYNDLEDAEKKIKDVRPAAVIVEPVLGAGGCIPAEREFLKALRELCDEIGAVLIFDEVITGFRFPRGASNYFNVRPDIITTGKAVGGQYFPGAGAICGKEEIMELIDHVKRPRYYERVFHGGTYVGNALTMRAGYELIRILRKEEDKIYGKMESLGRRFIKGLEDVFSNSDTEAHVTGVGSMVGLHFTREHPRDYESSERTKDVKITKELFYHMLNRGIAYLSPEKAHFFLSYAHSQEDIDYIIEVVEEFARSKRHD